MTVHGSNDQSVPDLGPKAAAIYRQFPELHPSVVPGFLSGHDIRTRSTADVAASVVAAAAMTARGARAYAASEAAATVASEAAQNAEIVQMRADAAAADLAQGVAATAARMALVVSAADLAFEIEVTAAADALLGVAGHSRSA